jgi:hypothetical protein
LYRVGGPTGTKLGTGSWSSICPENLRKSKVSDLGVDHEVATGDLGHAGNADYGGDLLPYVAIGGPVGIDLHNANRIRAASAV